ncbi:MAG: von Willebrand factor type A domain-containing protein [Acidobacteria bacterium]|nr:von Willebrand factor type A domain-containing protein [Acidobacteriota bacterium]
MKQVKTVLLRSVLVILVSTGLITLFPENPTSFASTQYFKKSVEDKDQLGTITGVITDQVGAVIAGATVIIKNLGTGAEITKTTKEDGSYEFLNLPIGSYEITVNADGFKKGSINLIEVSSSVSKVVNLVLEVGETSEVVTITAAEEIVQTTTSSVRTNINSKPSVKAPKTIKGKKADNNIVIERQTSQISTTYNARKIKELPSTSSNNVSEIIALTPGATNTTKSNGASTSGNTTNNTSTPIESNTEGYTNYGVNPWTNTKTDHFSTFAVDVDTGSYTIARRKLNEGVLPPMDSVRVEEFVNYFKYDYPNPATKHPFSLTMEASASPFNENRYLLRIGLKGREVVTKERPAAHLTFLVDNSGSMNDEDKLELVKRSLKMLVNHLQPKDTVAITTYAGGVELVLSPTHISDKEIILNAIEQLNSGGGTAMEAGIDLAYKQALSSLDPKSINRVIICSDGDANIGKTSHSEILKQIENYVEQGITVSTIGFGMGNYKDNMMEQFANKGNGNYYYVDTIAQAKRIFVEQLTGTLQVIAKDVKVQVEFNPVSVLEYRLVGYENRDIADEDFRNDEVDAGEIGAGHTVTAIYEVKLQKRPIKNLATVRLRYKTPNANKKTPAQEVAASIDLSRVQQNFNQTSEDFRFSIAVTAFAEILRNSQAAKDWSLNKIANIAETALQNSNQAYNKERQEFFQLVKKAQQLKHTLPPNPKP